MHKTRRIPIKRGMGYKFWQPSGTGIDLGIFELDHISKPTPEEDMFPLVICAEACLPACLLSLQLQNKNLMICHCQQCLLMHRLLKQSWTRIMNAIFK